MLTELVTQENDFRPGGWLQAEHAAPAGDGAADERHSLCGHRTERRAPVEGCVTAECTLTARRSWQVRLEVLRPGVPRRGVGDRLTLAMGLPT